MLDYQAAADGSRADVPTLHRLCEILRSVKRSAISTHQRVARLGTISTARNSDRHSAEQLSAFAETTSNDLARLS